MTHHGGITQKPVGSWCSRDLAIQILLLSLGKGLLDVYFNQENSMMSFSVQLGIVKSLSLKLREGVSLSDSTDGWTWIMAYGDPSALWSHMDLQFPEPSFWVTGGLHRVPSTLPGFSGGEEVPANQKSIICLQGTTRRPVGFTAPTLFSTTHPVFDSRIPSQLILPILHSHQREMDIGENKLFH